jgi:hypothetical protein
VAGPIEVPRRLLELVRSACAGLPEVVEEPAWVGTRWQVRSRTFAHLVPVADGWPTAYARAARTDGPAVALMFRSAPPDLDALRRTGPPFFAPPWRADEVGLLLPARGGHEVAGIEPDELVELLTDSYCVRAPERLARSVGRPDR